MLYLNFKYHTNLLQNIFYGRLEFETALENEIYHIFLTRNCFFGFKYFFLYYSQIFVHEQIMSDVLYFQYSHFIKDKQNILFLGFLYFFFFR